MTFQSITNNVAVADMACLQHQKPYIRWRCVGLEGASEGSLIGTLI